MKQPGLGGYNPHDVKADATWQKCTAINWTKVAGEPTMEGKLSLPSIQMTGMWPGCGRDVVGHGLLQLQSVGDMDRYGNLYRCCEPC